MQNVNIRNGAHSKKRVRVRVKSRFRFIMFLVIVFGLTVGAFGFVSGLNTTTASVVDDYTTYTVEAGDTLWDIANTFNYQDNDTRKIVYTICKLNDIQAEDLQPGMKLTIPTNL